MGLRHLINGAAGINSSLWERARAYVLLPQGRGYGRYGTGMVGSAQIWHRYGTDVAQTWPLWPLCPALIPWAAPGSSQSHPEVPWR